MSFLLDPPLLVLAGAATEELGLDRTECAAIEAGTVALFLVVSTSLWRDARWVRPVARLCGSRDGRDFMLNSGWFSLGLLRFDPADRSGRRAAIAALIFATYPMWFRAGRALRHRQVTS